MQLNIHAATCSSILSSTTHRCLLTAVAELCIIVIRSKQPPGAVRHDKDTAENHVEFGRVCDEARKSPGGDH